MESGRNKTYFNAREPNIRSLTAPGRDLMTQTKTSNPSIIETIDKMVKDGESEEKILNTLKDIGISPDNSRRLLILGQADVFSLLKGEIRRTLKQEFESGVLATAAPQAVDEKQTAKYLAEVREYEKAMAKQNESLRNELDEKIKRIVEMEEKTKTGFSEQSKALKEQIMDNLKEYEKGLGAQNKSFQEQLLNKVSKGLASDKAKIEFSGTGGSAAQAQFMETFKNYQKTVGSQSKEFQDGIGKKIEKMNELEEKTQKRLNQVSDEVKKVESDIGESGLRGVGTRNSIISYAVIGMGLIFGAGTLYTFYINMQAAFTTQSIITLTVMAIITVTLLVVGTLI